MKDISTHEYGCKQRKDLIQWGKDVLKSYDSNNADNDKLNKVDKIINAVGNTIGLSNKYYLSR